MIIYPANQSRQEYIETQIKRSSVKFEYSGISFHDILKYKTIIHQDMSSMGDGLGPILCLGTRNGREVDLFRMGFFGSRLWHFVPKVNEIRKESFRSVVPKLETMGRSEANNIFRKSVIGVEINPKAARSDIWTGSFDEMPKSWDKKFGVVYSNSFDHSQCPQKTAKEWKRITRRGGYLITCFAGGSKPNITDPIGDLNFMDFQELFGDEVIYFRRAGSQKGYSEAIFRLDRP